MPRPNLMPRAVAVAHRLCEEYAPYLVERAQLLTRVYRDLSIAPRTAKMYVEQAAEAGHLVVATMTHDEPMCLEAWDGTTIEVWVGDDRPRVRRGRYFTVMEEPPETVPYFAQYTFVMTPQQCRDIIDKYSRGTVERK